VPLDLVVSLDLVVPLDLVVSLDLVVPLERMVYFTPNNMPAKYIRGAFRPTNMTKKKLETSIEADKHSKFSQWADENYKSMAAALRDLAEQAYTGSLHTQEVTHEDILARIDELDGQTESEETQQISSGTDTEPETGTDNVPARKSSGGTTVTGLESHYTTYSGEIALDDPDSPMYDPDIAVAVPARDMPSLGTINALGSQYSDNSTDGKKGRKHAYAAVAHNLVTTSIHNSEGFTKNQFVDRLSEQMGVPERTAEDALAKMVSDGILHPNLTSQHGILTDSLLDEVRLDLADKTGLGPADDVLTDREKHKWPADWRKLLYKYDEVVNQKYYVDRENYLESIVETVKTSFVEIANLDPNQDRSGVEIKTPREDQLQAWNNVMNRMLHLLVAEFRDLDRSSDFWNAYLSAQHKVRQVTSNSTANGWVDDVKQVISDLRYYVDREVGSQTDSELMSVNDALSVLDFGDVPGTDELQARFRDLALENHPDVTDGVGDGDIEEIISARSALQNHIDDTATDDGDVTADSGSDQKAAIAE